MSDIKCSQVNCYEPIVFRYTWPGRDESFICAKHEQSLKAIALAMGLHVQTIPVEIIIHPIRDVQS